MKKPLSAFIVLLQLLRAGAAFAESPAVMILKLNQDSYRIEGEFTVKTSALQAWRLLSDYDRIGKFVSSVEESRLLERGEGYALVEQSNSGGFWFLKRAFKVILKVAETPNTRIEFTDVLKKDFRKYQGYWEIGNAGGKTSVRYHLEAECASRVPYFLVRRIIAKNIAGFLAEVAAEIEKNP